MGSDSWETRLRPRTQVAFGWQFSGQPYHEWPLWVQSSCTRTLDPSGNLALRLDRPSGAQLVYQGEWLVRELDGGILWFTQEMMNEEFEAVREAA